MVKRSIGTTCEAAELLAQKHQVLEAKNIQIKETVSANKKLQEKDAERYSRRRTP